MFYAKMKTEIGNVIQIDVPINGDAFYSICGKCGNEIMHRPEEFAVILLEADKVGTTIDNVDVICENCTSKKKSKKRGKLTC